MDMSADADEGAAGVAGAGAGFAFTTAERGGDTTERKSSGSCDAPSSAVDDTADAIGPSDANVSSAERSGEGRAGFRTCVLTNGVESICGGTPNGFGGAAGAGANERSR